MNKEIKILVVSHACIRQINRSVYRELANSIPNIKVIIPQKVTTASGLELKYEPAADRDPQLVPLELNGNNPRTYLYDGLVDQLNQWGPDVVLIENDPVSKLTFVLSSWCRKHGKKLICQTYENTRRGVISTIREQGWKALPKNLTIYMLNKWMSQKVDALLVVNRESDSIFKEYGYKQVTLIPLGYDKSIFYLEESLRQKYRSLLQISPDTPLIAYFGRMSRQKGVHTLIQALSQLKSVKWKLLLDHAFDPQNQYATYIQSLIKENQLEDRVIFFEANHYEIANYMRAADVAVAPSITTKEFKEQYGRAVQEAMACGCLCLVSESGHLPDLVKNPSLVFNENSVDALKQSLITWLNDKMATENCKLELANRAAVLLTTDCQGRTLAELIQRI
ncbi:MAG: glycosyltransferase family 4 protein [Bacteroidetes bacterium]|nr:glycosyltransferase family 4 protein [Bacteroidota bacterium]